MESGPRGATLTERLSRWGVRTDQLMHQKLASFQSDGFHSTREFDSSKQDKSPAVFIRKPALLLRNIVRWNAHQPPASSSTNGSMSKLSTAPSWFTSLAQK